MFDCIIRGGILIDGTGAPGYRADLAIKDGKIAEIGRIAGPATREINADGAIVTPGFVDIHTHYDGQFLWDDRLDPSFSHGVTTALAGNCGVGFAPARPEHRRALVELMEGVEEIPGVVLEAGLDWGWQSFGDYLNRLDERSYSMDIGVHLSHAPLRVFVMGDRALQHAPATAADLAEMADLVREAMAAGAMGFSGARVLEHLSSRGDNVPGSFANDDELLTLAAAMGESGHGVFQIIPLGANGDLMFSYVGEAARLAEHARIERVAEASGRPVTYTLMEYKADPADWQSMLAASERAAARGLSVHPQIHTRGIGALTTLAGYHIFMLRPSYLEVAHLSLPERVAALRDPRRRAAILAEQSVPDPADPKLAGFVEMLRGRIANIFPMTLPLDYEPAPERRLGALAAAAGKTQEEYLYDHYTADQGHNVCASFALNFAGGSLEPIRALLAHPLVVSGLGDGGAHVRMACDSALPTFQLTFWARDRERGETLPLPWIVEKLTRKNAELYGLTDRGVLAVGKRADINVIDHARLTLQMPHMLNDLPNGGARLMQGADGYIATLVNGVPVRLDGVETGARPGRLLRGQAGRGEGASLRH